MGNSVTSLSGGDFLGSGRASGSPDLPLRESGVSHASVDRGSHGAAHPLRLGAGDAVAAGAPPACGTWVASAWHLRGVWVALGWHTGGTWVASGFRSQIDSATRGLRGPRARATVAPLLLR